MQNISAEKCKATARVVEDPEARDDESTCASTNSSMPPAHLVRLQTYLPRIYNRLLQAIQASALIDDESGKNGDNAGIGSSLIAGQVREILTSKDTPWVWVGGSIGTGISSGRGGRVMVSDST